MSIRRLILFAVATLTFAVMATAIAGQQGVAIALMSGVALLMFAWVVLWARAINEAVAVSVPRPVLDRLDDQARSLEQVRRDVYGVLVTVQRTPSVVKELDRVYDRVVHVERPMPELGDWAMTPSTLVWVMDQIATGRVSTILECGSGSSTVWFASALAHRGTAGRVVSLESSEDYARQTRDQLAELGLSDWATVIHAPLVPVELDGRAAQPWFDLSGLSGDVRGVDLLFVDGPIGAIAPEARYPGFPLLKDRLAAESWVVLDDTGRPDEAAIVQQWADESQSGGDLSVVRVLDRATVLAFRSGEPLS